MLEDGLGIGRCVKTMSLSVLTIEEIAHEKSRKDRYYYNIYFFDQIETTDSQYGVLKIQNSPPPTGNVLSFANPAYEPSAAMPTYKVEDVLIRGKPSITTSSVGFVTLKSNYFMSVQYVRLNNIAYLYSA